MIRQKIKCEICGEEISKSNMSKHLRRHKEHPETFEQRPFALTHSNSTCQFCGKKFQSRNALCNHERLCKANPNGQTSAFKKYNKEHETWNKGLTVNTSDGVRKQSQSLKQWYEEHPNHGLGGFRILSAKKCKYGTYKGFYCDSGWELAFLIYCLDNDIPITRNQDAFTYVINGKKHNYYPDFIIDGIYYEIKGIYREFDNEKIAQFPSDKTLVVVDKQSINIYISYCKEHYGQNFEMMYDRNFPSWMDCQTNAKKQYNFSKRKS